MPISETGNSETGFSLIELMVALAIFGLLSAIVIIRLPDGRGPPRVEAEKLAVRLQALRMEAVSTARAMRVTMAPGAAKVEQRQRGQWVALDKRAFGFKVWPKGITATPARIVFEPTGLSSGDGEVQLMRGDAQVLVAIAPAGDVRVR